MTDYSPLIQGLLEQGRPALECGSESARLTSGFCIVDLTVVYSPVTQLRKEGRDMTALMEDPDTAQEVIEECWRRTEARANESTEGILYVIWGADPEFLTPMQFGGLFLEREREFLTRVKKKGVVVLWMEGDSEVYLDSVSDLPADVIGWRMTRENLPLREMRPLTNALIAGSDREADIPVEAALPELSI